MNSTQKAASPAMEPEKATPTCLQTPEGSLKYWPTLSAEEQAFVVAYVENSYSISAASEELELPATFLRKMLSCPDVKKAVTEVQEAMGDIEFLNEKWVKTQLLRIFPMVMGDEAVPMIDASGNQITGRKFVPDVAMKVLEYVTPKKAPTVQIDIHNTIDLRSAVAEGHARRKAAIESAITITVEEEEEPS